MAGGMMSQVTGMIPGMKKEEEVPDVAPQEGEYQEYTVKILKIKYKATPGHNPESIDSPRHNWLIFKEGGGDKHFCT